MKRSIIIPLAFICVTCFTSCMRNVNTQQQLQALQGQTYVCAIIVALVIVLLACLISYMIPWQGDKDKSYIKRRWTLVGCVAIGSLGFLVYNQTYVMNHIQQPAFQNQFFSTNLLCFLITILGSIVFSLIVMVCFKHSKFASIIFKIKGK